MLTGGIMPIGFAYAQTGSGTPGSDLMAFLPMVAVLVAIATYIVVANRLAQAPQSLPARVLRNPFLWPGAIIMLGIFVAGTDPKEGALVFPTIVICATIILYYLWSAIISVLGRSLSHSCIRGLS